MRKVAVLLVLFFTFSIGLTACGGSSSDSGNAAPKSGLAGKVK